MHFEQHMEYRNNKNDYVIPVIVGNEGSFFPLRGDTVKTESSTIIKEL